MYPNVNKTVTRYPAYRFAKLHISNKKFDMQFEYCDMTPESRSSSFLVNGSVNIFPWKRTCATIEESVSNQRIGKHTTIGVLLETVFSVGVTPKAV
jgi:hypothetical protein